MTRTFSIITTCKGRLDHLKQSLPTMVRQAGAEVIVVDYACPEDAGAYVSKHFPSAQVVKVDGEEGFSNWRARNRGAAVAKGDMLVFCDADTFLAEGALQTIAESVPEKSFGFFTRHSTTQFNRKGLRLGLNQLRGFQVVPAAAFRRLGGYDELLEGWGAGGDTDLEERLMLFGIKGVKLGDGIIEDVLEHDNEARVTYHRSSIKFSYAAGLFYRRAKMTLLKLRRGRGLSGEERRMMYDVARTAAQHIADGDKSASMQIKVEDTPVGMPRQLGFEQAKCTVSIAVRIAGKGKVEVPPQ